MRKQSNQNESASIKVDALEKRDLKTCYLIQMKQRKSDRARYPSNAEATRRRRLFNAVI